jgi:hypothetical protein
MGRHLWKGRYVRISCESWSSRFDGGLSVGEVSGLRRKSLRTGVPFDRSHRAWRPDLGVVIRMHCCCDTTLSGKQGIVLEVSAAISGNLRNVGQNRCDERKSSREICRNYIQKLPSKPVGKAWGSALHDSTFLRITALARRLHRRRRADIGRR